MKMQMKALGVGAGLCLAGLVAAPANGDLIMTEIGDPTNNPRALFVEVFNNGGTAVDLTDWSLAKYNDGSATPGVVVDLGPAGTLVPGDYIVVGAQMFEDAFFFAPTLVFTLDDDSQNPDNGNDAWALRAPGGGIVDIYGEIGVDGVGTVWEYRDGRAVREPSAQAASDVFLDANWFTTTQGTGGNDNPFFGEVAPGDYDPFFWDGASTDDPNIVGVTEFNVGTTETRFSITRDYVVTNTGDTQTLDLTGATFSGVNASNFEVLTDPLPTGIAPGGGTAVLEIEFTPTPDLAVGYEATLTITSNDEGGDDLVVTVTATATPSTASADATWPLYE